MIRLMVALIGIGMMVSCDKTAAFDTYQELSGSWHKDSVVVFKVKDMDSISSYNTFIQLRNTNDFAYSNLFLITQMQFPNGRTFTDTLEYEMARPDGSWLGDGFGDLKENILWYRSDVRFRESGTYTFKIRQAMRKNGQVEPIAALEGINDVGLRIEKINK